MIQLGKNGMNTQRNWS